MKRSSGPDGGQERGASGRVSGSTRPVIKPATAYAGEVRLIGGLWKRTKLTVADRPGLRPTPDRVRETLFNWLGQDLSGWRVLDAFAGTGALGLEAASRGAAEVLLLDHDASLVAGINSTAARLGAKGVQALRADALMWMARSAAARFELVLIDPPYQQGESTATGPIKGPALGPATGPSSGRIAAAAAVAAVPLLVPGGWLFVEAGEALTDLPAGLRPYRTLRAGAVHGHLWQREL